jgi:hypothetical protein
MCIPVCDAHVPVAFISEGVKGGMEAPDIRRKLEDDENKNRKSANDDSLGMFVDQTSADIGVMPGSSMFKYTYYLYTVVDCACCMCMSPYAVLTIVRGPD